MVEGKGVGDNFLRFITKTKKLALFNLLGSTSMMDENSTLPRLFSLIHVSTESKYTLLIFNIALAFPLDSTVSVYDGCRLNIALIILFDSTVSANN